MMDNRILPLLLSAVVLAAAGAPFAAGVEAGAGTGSPAAARSTSATFDLLCAQCHGADRLGGTGPALIPATLGRLSPAEAERVILQGRPATQMPAFAPQVDADTARRLVDYIFAAPAETPRWDLAKIRASHRVLVAPAGLPERPLHGSDPLNLFVVVELGDHAVTILDGDRLAPIHRFQTHSALHGGAKFSPDGRFVYFASRTGWISRFDLHSLQTVAEVRAGINTRNLAVSGDGRIVAVANSLPHSLVLLDARDLSPIRLIPVADDQGKSSRVSAVYAAPPRRSFVAALKDIPEVWEIGYADEQHPVYSGPMHDDQTAEGGAQEMSGAAGPFAIRRVALADHLDDFFFDQDYRLLIGAARNGRQGQVVDLDAGRKVADLKIDGMPHLGSGITWERNGRTLLATPHLEKSEVSVIDMGTWQTVARIETLGPGFFLRSHENTPYAWADVYFGPHKDAVHVIDKRSLAIVRTLRPAPGKTAAHVEFDRYGKYALLSVSEPAPDGALVVYDAATLEEIKRIPMNKPSGKYNVYNKIHRSEGTSH